MKIYSVRDINVGFNAPFVEINDEVAKRGFAYAVTNTDMIGFRPADFDLFCIGEFDKDKGTISPYDLPQLVLHATECVGV